MSVSISTLIDWDDDGDFGDIGEDVTARVRSVAGTTINRGRDQARPLSPPMAGLLNMLLDNQSGDYSPENSSSPLNGFLYPGHTTVFRASYGSFTYNEPGTRYDEPGVPYDGSGYDLFTGVLDEVSHQPDVGKRLVSAPALGPLSKLVGKKVSTALYQNITTAVALGHILDAVGWSATARIINTGYTTLQWWALDEEDAFQAAAKLLNSEGPGATIYESGDGRIVFEGRNYRIVASRGITPTRTYRSQGAEPLLSPPFAYIPKIADIVNIATAQQFTRTLAGSLTAVWTLGATLTLGANETRTFLARSTTGDPFSEAVAPVLTTDYAVSAGSVASTALNRTSGYNVTISIAAGAGGATVTGLQMRAKLAPVTATTSVTNSSDTSVSRTRYGDRKLEPAILPEITVDEMQSLMNLIVATYSVARPKISFRVIGANDTRIAAILRQQISDRVTVINGETRNITYNESGIDYDEPGMPYDGATYQFQGDIFVEELSYSLQAGVLSMAVGGEKATSSPVGFWGSGLWGTALWGF